MSDSFRYGDKNEINFEQFAQKLNNVQSTSNADLWKLFGIFDRDKNGKIENKNSSGEMEAKSLFDFLQEHSGENKVLDDDELEAIFKDSHIAEKLENTEGVIAALKEFFNSFTKEDEITEEVKDGITVRKQNNRIIELVKDRKTVKYTYNKDSVEIETPTENITVSKVEDDGSYLSENFIKKVYKNENGEEVSVVKDKNGRITETVTKNDNESVTTIFNTSSVHVYDNYKSEPSIQVAQVMIKNGEEYFVLYDSDGNTVTHAANNDSISKLLKHLGFESVEQLYRLNPKLKNPKHELKVGESITVPGHRNVTDAEIQNQGSIAGETNKYVKAYNAKIQREHLESLEKFRQENLSGLSKEIFEALNNTKGFELTNENLQMYFKISQLPKAAQKALVAGIQVRVEKGQTPDAIKEYYLNNPVISLDGKNLTAINLFDGLTIELPGFSEPETMHIGNFIKNCNTELLFNEAGGKTRNFSIKTFFQKILGLDITKGEGKVLYEQFCNLNDPVVMMDINAMFANIARRTTSGYRLKHAKAQNELTDSYKKTILGQGIAQALNENKPLSQTEAKEMYKAVIQSLTAPKGQTVKTKYDSFINDHKDFYLRKFATEMVSFLYNRNGALAQQTSDSKSILNPVGKLTLGALAPRYSKDAQSIYALMSSDCYLGNKKIESTIKGYDTEYKGYDRAKVKRCWDIMQNPNATEEQKTQALSDAFGARLVHSAENLSGVCAFADGVTDIILLMYGTGIIGKGLTKALSLIPRAGAVAGNAEAIITGSRALSWGQRLTSVGVSSATFSIYDSAKFAVDYYSSDMYTAQNISFGDGITSAAAHSAMFGGFASIWGQAVTGNVLKWLFKTPQGEEVAAETMRLLTKQFKNSSKISGKQIVSAFQSAQAKAVSSASKEIAGFGSELIGFSTYEILQKAYNGELKDSSLTEILSGQFKTLLSFKAVGKILFMHKAGKLPQDTIKLDTSKDVSVEPVTKNGRTEYKVTYPDGRIVTVPDMQAAVALCNRHYEDVTIYEPLAKTLETENKLELDDGITITKDENGYTVKFSNDEQVSSENLRDAMSRAQAKYQLIQLSDELFRNGKCTLPSGQSVIYDSQNDICKTVLESGTEVSGVTLEVVLQNASEVQLCENIETSLKKNNGKVFLDENTLLVKVDENSYELKIVLDNGLVLNFKGKSINEVLSRANSAKQFVQIFGEEAQETTSQDQTSTGTKRQSTLGITDEMTVPRREQNGPEKVEASKFETSEDGVKQILSIINQKHAEQTNVSGADYYNEEECSRIMKLFKSEPEFVMNLLKEQLSIEKSGSQYNISPAQIETLIRLKKDFPDIYDKMPIRDELTGKIRGGLDRYSDAVYFMWSYQDNPELTIDFANRRYKSGNSLPLMFDNYVDLANAIHNMDKNPELKEALNAKVISTDGTEHFAYSYKQVRDGLLSDFVGLKEKTLMQLKTKDGKYQLFSQEDIEMLIGRDIDQAIKDIKNPEKADDAIKEIMILLADSKLYDAANKRIEPIYDSLANEFMKSQIPADAYAVDIGELYVDGTYELRVLTDDGIKTVRFSYDKNSFDGIKVIAREEVISKDEHSTAVRTEFADGRVIIDRFENGSYEAYGKQRTYVKSQTRTEYDRDGEPVYEEVITPSKVVLGEMDVITADRVNGRVQAAETQMFGQKVPMLSSHKKLTSENGLTTETFVTQEQGCRKSSYVIKDADNNVILSIERQHLQVDENNFISVVNGRKYDIAFEDDKITVTKEGANGKPSETISLDSKMIAPELIPLLKQLPGDFLFTIKKSGVSSIKVSSSSGVKNGAYFNRDTNSIVISPELMKDSYVFAHELGHAMDDLLLGNLSSDEQLRQIFEKELGAYRSRVSDAEARIIDYFSTRIHYSGNNLLEVVAEVNAIISGFRTTDSPLFMRGLKLMQNFPETIKYVSDKLNTALDGKIQVSDSQPANTGMRLGITEQAVAEKPITIFDELEVDIENLETKDDIEIVQARLNAQKENLTAEEYSVLQTKLEDSVAQFNQSEMPGTMKGKGLVFRHDEQKSAQLEAERKVRVAALDLMNVNEFSELGRLLDNMIDTLDISNTADVAQFKDLVARGNLSETERLYFQTLLDNRLNPPTFDNYKPEQIAAETQHLIRHFKKAEPYIIENTKDAGLKSYGHVSQRVKSDTSTYDKLYNFIKDKKDIGATLMDALGDVRDEFGTRSLMDADDFTDKPNVKRWLDAANEEGLTPQERRSRLIQAAREAAIYQSEDLVWTLQQQMIKQKNSNEGLKAVRMVNYASADGVPVLSETQLWELYRFAEELGLDPQYIKIIELKEVKYSGGEIRVQAKDIFTKEVMEGGEYTTLSQKSGYTAFQMNFETKNGDKLEFQARDVITDEFAEKEHLIYDTITGKDIVGRHPKLRPLYDQLLQVLDKDNLDERVCKKYRTEYLKDYYTYCRAKSLGIDIGEPQLRDYAKRWSKELDIPDLQLDPRLDAKNLMALHDVATAIKHEYLSEYDGVELYQLHVQFSRGEAPQDVFNTQAERLWTDMQRYCETDIKLEDMKNLSQQELVAKLDVFKTFEKDFANLREVDRYPIIYIIMHLVTPENLHSVKEMYHYLKEFHRQTGEDFEAISALRIASNTKPEARYYAQEFIEATKDNQELRENLGFEFLITDSSAQTVKERLELYKFFTQYTHVEGKFLYTMLEQNQNTYQSVMEVYKKVMENKNLDDKQKENLLKSLPYDSSNPKNIADNFEFLVNYINRGGSAYEISRLAYILELSHPDDKQTLVDELIDSNKPIWVQLEGYRKAAGRGFYKSTKQSEYSNQNILEHMKKRCLEIGFTEEELENCTVETLQALNMYSSYLSVNHKTMTEENKKILMNNNLDKRINILNLISVDYQERLFLCSDEEFDTLSKKIIARPQAQIGSHLSTEEMDKLLSITDEEYNKLNTVYENLRAKNYASFETMSLLLSLTDKGLDNAVARWSIIDEAGLTFEQKRSILEMSEEDFEKKSTKISERQGGKDIDKEAYRAEVRAKLDGSYTLNMSAYEKSRAKKAADMAKYESRKKIIPFDENRAIAITPKAEKSDVIPESKDLIKQLKKKGEVSVSIPVQGELHPKGDETKGKIEETRQLGEFSTGITLHYGEGRNWDNSRFARDMLQNFYDGNGNTLEGVDIEIKKENGRYKVKISGKGIYDYKQVFKLGKNDHTSKDAGKYGEGLKVMFATLLDSRGTTYVKHSSGDWVINLTAEQGAESSSRTRVFGDLQRAETRQEGATVEFDTTDEELVHEILKAKDYFYSPYNPDFQNFDYENEYFGIKFLPKGEKGNIYVVQRYEADSSNDSGLDDTIEGATLVFKVMPDNPDVVNAGYNRYSNFRLETGRNRIPLTDFEIQQLVNRYAETISDEDLVRIIGSMKDVYIHKNGKQRGIPERILYALCSVAHTRNIKIDFGHDKFIAVDNRTSREDIQFALRMGKTLVVESMESIGVPNLGKYLEEAKKEVYPKAQLTEVQANKIKLIDEAVKLFTENLDLSNLNIITPEEAANPRYIYDKPDRDKGSGERAEAIVDDDKSYGMWISSDFIDSKNNDLFEYMGTWLHEISHKVGGDGERVFNERLKKLVMLVSQMCETDPAFRTKLTVLNEEFKKLNGKKSKDMSEELNSDAYREQMEQSLRWLTEDPELPPVIPEGYKPTVLDYLANQKDRLERTIDKKTNQYTMKFANWVVRMSQKLEDFTADWRDDSVVREPVQNGTERKESPVTEQEQTVITDTENTNIRQFIFRPTTEELIPDAASRTDKQFNPKEMSIIRNTGSLVIDMPPLTDKAPKIEFSGIRESDRARFEASKTEESQMTLNYNSSNAWSLPQVARDMLQNMYDGHNGTLDGVKFDITFKDGKYRIKISGQSEYDYFHIENIGASGEDNLNDGTRGGGFGEGAKMVPLHLLYGKYVDNFTYASGDWKIDFSRQKDAQGNELPVDEGYMMMTPGINKERISGNYVEFETTDPELVQAILVARDYFNHSDNTDFRNFDVETPDMGIRVLPAYENGNLYYNQRYSIKTDGENNCADFDAILDGLRIVFKRTLSKKELADVRMSKDCDRLGLSKVDIVKITKTLAKSMSNKQLMETITRLQRYWIFKGAPSEYEIRNFEQSFVQGLIDLAIERGLSFKDVSSSKIVCVDALGYSKAKAQELMRRGYTIADNTLSYLGFPTINDIFEDATRIEPYQASDLTLKEQQKLRLLEEALGISKSDEKNGFQAAIVVFEPSIYQGKIEFYTREVEGFDAILPYLAIDRRFLEENDFQTCYNALISGLRRSQQCSSEADFGYNLTDLIRYQLRELSLPQNAKKLKLIEERYKEIE